jgi:CheY-like chemotaxis protein
MGSSQPVIPGSGSPRLNQIDTGREEMSPADALEMHTRCMFSPAGQSELPVVLLIDDDLVSREVTATLLTMSGYTVHTAENGEASLKLLSAGGCRPNVILMDAQMPGLSGCELIAKLRSRTKARIYIVSGSNPPDELVAAADGFLIKPFNADALHKILNGHKAHSDPSLLDPNDPILSVEILTQFRKLMPEAAVRQIYIALAADLFKRIEALAGAIAKGDAEEIHRIGHAIKGGCGMAGAVQAAHLGALLEATSAAPEDNQLDNSATLLRDLRTAAQGLERMLEAELPA